MGNLTGLSRNVPSSKKKLCALKLLCLSQQWIWWWCQEGPVFSAGRQRSWDLPAWGCRAEGPHPHTDWPQLQCSRKRAPVIHSFVHACIQQILFRGLLCVKSYSTAIEIEMNKTVPAFKELRVEQRRWDRCPKKNKAGQNVMSARGPRRESTHFQLGSRSLHGEGLEGRGSHGGSQLCEP